MKKSHIVFLSLCVMMGIASVALAIAVNSSDVVAAEVAEQFAAGSATHIATTIITGALVAAAGILWYLSFHRKNNKIKAQSHRSNATSTSKSVGKSANNRTKTVAKTSTKAASTRVANAKTKSAGKTSKATAKTTKAAKPKSTRK